MLAERKLSSKINYDVLRGLKSEDGTSIGGGPPDNDGIDLTGGLTPKIETTTSSTTGVGLSTIVEEGEDGTSSGGRQMAVVYESGPTLPLSSKRGASKRRWVIY